MRTEFMSLSHEGFVGLCFLDLESEDFSQHHFYSTLTKFNPFIFLHFYNQLVTVTFTIFLFLSTNYVTNFPCIIFKYCNRLFPFLVSFSVAPEEG